MEVTSLLNVADQTFTRYSGIFGIFATFQFFLYFTTISRGTLDDVLWNPGWETLACGAVIMIPSFISSIFNRNFHS
jgi:hypothetical protein